MSRIEVHTEDLPSSAVRKQKLPRTYLGFLREEAFPSPDGKGMVSLEDQMLRQHWDAMLMGNATARDWLLGKVMKENAALLRMAPEHPAVTIDAVHKFQPLGPVLEILGCATINHPEEWSEEPSTVALSEWFVEALEGRCRPDEFATVLAWQNAGGKQSPRISRDRHD